MIRLQRQRLQLLEKCSDATRLLYVQGFLSEAEKEKVIHRIDKEVVKLRNEAKVNIPTVAEQRRARWEERQARKQQLQQEYGNVER